jgi:type IV secretory pathway TraG/TraD family ATPase VirD4
MAGFFNYIFCAKGNYEKERQFFEKDKHSIFWIIHTMLIATSKGTTQNHGNRFRFWQLP